mmetsp:Transcript_12236/g.38357  ORF Transcript_12236/g.38357 Transcript_12236/m.38357 type:complete len:91 (-) Transcript_12236:1018-1290(-)
MRGCPGNELVLRCREVTGTDLWHESGKESVRLFALPKDLLGQGSELTEDLRPDCEFCEKLEVLRSERTVRKRKMLSLALDSTGTLVSCKS